MMVGHWFDLQLVHFFLFLLFFFLFVFQGFETNWCDSGLANTYGKYSVETEYHEMLF